MPRIRNRFKILLAEKEVKTGKSYPYRKILEETGIGLNSLTAWANNRVKRFDASSLLALCAFFECSIGDLLEIVE